MKLQKVIRLTENPVFRYGLAHNNDRPLTKLKPSPVRLKAYWKQRMAIKELEILLEQNVKLDVIQEAVWSALVIFQNHPFYTAKGLEFRYYIKGNEVFFSRKDKSITRATIHLAMKRALELDGIVSGPKKLGCFGASYLYPVLLRLKFIQKHNR